MSFIPFRGQIYKEYMKIHPKRYNFLDNLTNYTFSGVKY